MKSAYFLGTAAPGETPVCCCCTREELDRQVKLMEEKGIYTTLDAIEYFLEF